VSATERTSEERDAKLATLYRETALDAPPPALDDAIRAAARRAVAAGPRAIGTPFLRRWQVPLSLAAVLVLSVSLISIMREESPELTEAPRADAPVPEPKREATFFPPAAEQDRASAQTGVRAREPGGLGLKPSAPGSSSLGMRNPADSGSATAPRFEATPARKAAPDRMAAAPAAARPEAFPGGAPPAPAAPAVAQAPREQQSAQRESEPPPSAPVVAGALSTDALSSRARGAAMSEEAKAAKNEARADTEMRDRAVARAAPNPAFKAAPAAEARSESFDDGRNLAPAKWLERIQALRDQGRIAEAKASLAEFRKRYPDYLLPAPLRDWAAP
jgi:hypothetical protein